MSDPAANLRAFLAARVSSKKPCNPCNFVTGNENKDLGRLHACNRDVTHVTGLHGYTDAENGRPARVTEKTQQNESLSPRGYTVTRLHETERQGGKSTNEPESQSDTFVDACAVTNLGADAVAWLCDVIRYTFRTAAERFERERGVSRPVAEASARALVRGELLNNDWLVPEQSDPWRCLICGGGKTEQNPLVPICSPIKDQNLWLHLEQCHAAHLQRQGEKADALLIAALGREHWNAAP